MTVAQLKEEIKHLKHQTLEDTIRRKALESELTGTRVNLCDMTLELHNHTVRTVADPHRNFDVNGFDRGYSSTMITASGTAAQFNVFAKPSSHYHMDVRVQLAEEGKIGQLVLMNDAVTFWPWWQTFKEHAMLMHWNVTEILGNIPATTLHNGHPVHLLYNFYMLTIQDVMESRDAFINKLKVNPESQELQFIYTKCMRMYVAIIASIDTNIRYELLQYQELIQGDGPVLACTLVDILAPSVGRVVDDAKVKLTTTHINDNVPSFYVAFVTTH